MLPRVRRALSRQLVGRTAAARLRPLATRILASEQVETPELLDMALFPEAEHLRGPRYESGEVHCFELTGVLVYTYLNLVLTRTRRVIAESENDSLLHPGVHPCDRLDWHGLYARRPTPIAGTVVPLRSASNNYYHTLVDNLPRLYALHRGAGAEHRIRLLVAERLQPWEAYFLPLVLPANVEIAFVPRNTLFAPERCLLSGFLSRQMAGYLPREYLAFFLPRVLPRRPRQRSRRLYVTRRHSPVGRRILNDDELSRRLERRGFQTVALESLPVAEQIELFYDARLVVGAHGAGLTNLLFAAGAGVVELHPASRLFPHYYFLCKAMRHEYRYLCGTAAGRNSDFSVDPDRVERLLDALERSVGQAGE
jgi:capsular polysaccharide biosynthesis protein